MTKLRPVGSCTFPYFPKEGEPESEVDDKQARIGAVDNALADARGDGLDGLTVEFDDWSCNVRSSNTEPRFVEVARVRGLREAQGARVARVPCDPDLVS